MKELDLSVFVAVFHEMLGVLFWPAIALAVLGAVVFLAVIIRDRGINPRRLILAELLGFVGGFVGIWLMLLITSSKITDLGGPIDWLLTALIWIAGAIGAAIVAYILMALAGGSARVKPAGDSAAQA
jgi:hypothetical protein